MARIVLGLGLAHTPQVHTAPEQWHQRLEADHRNKSLWFRGQAYDWKGLVDARAGENLASQAEPAERQARHARANAAVAAVAQAWRDARPDVAVILGNDQHELFVEDLMPAFTIFWGKELQNLPSTTEQIARKPAGIHLAHHGHAPPQPLSHPGEPELGRHLIERAMADGFDVAQSQWLREADQRISFSSGIPHAFGFVYRNVMGDQVPPNVPVIINTFFPPNQPTAARCLALGRSIGRAIASWQQDLRVAVIGSGGLSHFVVDETFDRAFLAALVRADHEALVHHPEPWFQAGTSECKNWIAAAGALEGANLQARVVDYVPCYRSEAGTGTGAGFVVWS
ncbi:MAG: protocatechuate 3,4-dioxygenase [Rubrivivax sp.]|nr:protocatechuate 3,4-dioxygenase [Rubrivivax sp.]